MNSNVDYKEILGDSHNFGKSVVRTLDGFVMKPRCLFWEWLFLSRESLLCRMLSQSESLLKRIFDIMPKIEFCETADLLKGGRVQYIETKPLNNTLLTPIEHESIGGVIAFLTWFGIGDLHAKNMIAGLTIEDKFMFGPLDIECIFLKFSLPSQSRLIPTRHLAIKHCGIDVLLQSGLKFELHSIAALCSGYIKALFVLKKLTAEIHNCLHALEAHKYPIRMILRDTYEYKHLLETINCEGEKSNHSLMPSEWEQLQRGDIPFYFHYPESKDVYYMNSQESYSCISVPRILHKRRRFSWERAKWVVLADLAQIKTPHIEFSSPCDIENALEAIIEMVTHCDVLGDYQSYTLKKLSDSKRYLHRCYSANLGEVHSLSQIPQLYKCSMSYKDLLLQKQVYEELKASRVRSSGSNIVDYFDSELTRGESWGKLISARGRSLLSQFSQSHENIPIFDYESMDVASHEGVWKNLVTFENERLILMVNTFPQQGLTAAMIDFFASHEICGHMVHLSLLRKNKLLQQQFPHLLCISIHTQDCFVVEAIAQLLAHLVSNIECEGNSMLRVVLARFELTSAVRSYNLQKLQYGEHDTAHAGSIHEKILSGCAREHATWYAQVVSNPLFSYQILSYHASFAAIAPLLKLNDVRQKKHLHELIHQFHSPESLRAIVSKACNDKNDELC